MAPLSVCQIIGAEQGSVSSSEQTQQSLTVCIRMLILGPLWTRKDSRSSIDPSASPASGISLLSNEKLKWSGIVCDRRPLTFVSLRPQFTDIHKKFKALEKDKVGCRVDVNHQAPLCDKNQVFILLFYAKSGGFYHKIHNLIRFKCLANSKISWKGPVREKQIVTMAINPLSLSPSHIHRGSCRLASTLPWPFAPVLTTKRLWATG